MYVDGATFELVLFQVDVLGIVADRYQGEAARRIGDEGWDALRHTISRRSIALNEQHD